MGTRTKDVVELSREETPVGVSMRFRTTTIRESSRSVQVDTKQGKVWLGLVELQSGETGGQISLWEYLDPDQAERIAALLLAAASEIRAMGAKLDG